MNVASNHRPLSPSAGRALGASIVLGLAGTCALTGCGRQPPEPSTPQPKVNGEAVVFPSGAPQLASIMVQPAQKRTLAITRLAGRLDWDDNRTVRVFTPLLGQVAKVRVEPGQRVSANAPLAEISSPDFGQALSDARTDAANLVLADKTLARTKDLFEHGAAAAKDVEAAVAADASVSAEKDRTAARLKLYGGTDTGNGEDYVLRSPIAGVVVEKNINPGQEVRPDQMLANAPQLFAPLFVISDPAHLWVLVDAAEANLAALHPGLSLVVRSPSLPGREFAGRVEWVSDSLDPTTHVVTVRGTVDNSERLLKAEMLVSVEFESAGAPGVDVPAAAVFLKGEKHFVYIEQEPGNYLRREVEVGPEYDGKILVVRGLQAGQRVVTAGNLLLDEVQADTGGN